MNDHLKPKASDSHSPAEPNEIKPVFVGHTRFSVRQHGSGNFVATRKGERGAGFNNEQYTEWLYSSKRMQPRMEIFARFGVPQLSLASRDYNVVHYVSYSPSLPEEYKSTLRTIADSHSFIRLNEVEEGKPVTPLPSTAMINAALASLDLPNVSTVGVYRLDDDDVLAADYFFRMAPYARPEFAGFWVSLGLGVAALQSDEDLIYAREWYFPKIAIGLMYVLSPALRREGDPIGHINHRLVDFKAPTIIDSREPGWFHVRHPGQDTNLTNEPNAFFSKNFRKVSGRGSVRGQQLSRLFPALASRVHSTPGDPTRARALVEQPLTCRGATPKFYLEAGRPLAINVSTELKGTLKDVLLHFSLRGQSDSEEAHNRRFLRSQGAKYSIENRSYFVSFISEESSSEHVAVLECPPGVAGIEVWLESSKSNTFNIEKMTVYPLSGLA